MLLFASVLFLLLATCRHPEPPPAPAVGVLADSAMVVTGHFRAAEIARDVLRRGGNAFDAAFAAHFALAVLHPRAGNLGGGGFAVFRRSDGQAGSLDFRERDEFLPPLDGGPSYPTTALPVSYNGGQFAQNQIFPTHGLVGVIGPGSTGPGGAFMRLYPPERWVDPYYAGVYVEKISSDADFTFELNEVSYQRL